LTEVYSPKNKDHAETNNPHATLLEIADRVSRANGRR